MHIANLDLKISDGAVRTLKRFTSFLGRPEPDGEGEWCVGWGHYGDDFPHSSEFLLSPDVADNFLEKDLAMLREAVLAEHGDDPLTQEQFDSLMLDTWGRDGFP